MKKLILILAITLSSTPALAKCVEAPDMREFGKGEDRVVTYRCENKEAVCYLWGPSISCFPKK